MYSINSNTDDMTINPYVKAWILLSLLYDQTLRCVCVLCMRRLSLPRKKQFEAPDTFTKSYFLCKYLLIAVHRSHSDTHHFLCVLLLLICFGTIPVHLLPRASLLAFDSKQYASYEIEWSKSQFCQETHCHIAVYCSRQMHLLPYDSHVQAEKFIETLSVYGNFITLSRSFFTFCT